MARGQWWEYVIPGHSGALIAGDMLDTVTGKTKQNEGGGVLGNRNSRVNAAQNDLDTLKAKEPGAYQSAYKTQIDDAQSQLGALNDKGFSYDYTKDTAYQQYKNQYTRGAELASADATARAAARSGGYGNSWGTSSGQTAYQSTMNGLSDVADSLYSQAYNEYAGKKTDLTNRISALQQQEQLAQDAYNTKVQNYWNQYNNAAAEYANAQNAKQQKAANGTELFGSIASLAAAVAPYLIKALMAV